MEASGSTEKQSFVDLGCGNGLLVYILTKEGYRGAGVDLRSRKIWDSFGEGIDLRVETVTPSAKTRMSGFDWLLGNHSDELTPWIPTVAALTSSETKFWVLPCCPFEFKAKFRRRNTDKSAYRDYLDYVKTVGETCGFIMEEDKLRIPSTKRICFVGRTKKYSPEERDGVLVDVLKMIEEGHEVSEPSEKKPKLDFVPRQSEIAVRNCTRVDKGVVGCIVKKIVAKCLEVTNPLSNESSKLVHAPLKMDWNAGGLVPLGEAVAALEQEELSQLKSQCGGLQTLLRNHSFIFVVRGGSVRLKCPAIDGAGANKKKGGKAKKGATMAESRKKKLCWFFENHPQGCPVSLDDCHWAHGEADLAR